MGAINNTLIKKRVRRNLKKRGMGGAFSLLDSKLGAGKASFAYHFWVSHRKRKVFYHVQSKEQRWAFLSVGERKKTAFKKLWCNISYHFSKTNFHVRLKKNTLEMRTNLRNCSARSDFMPWSKSATAFRATLRSIFLLVTDRFPWSLASWNGVR